MEQVHLPHNHSEAIGIPVFRRPDRASVHGSPYGRVWTALRNAFSPQGAPFRLFLFGGGVSGKKSCNESVWVAPAAHHMNTVSE